ncbi:RNHCP domain-containing protein [Proteinivorax tanatarense]|uniref:RNHCP domain-containing protein n=1 Tax=Proteinivorax tanatarense TaxID=1260629 RepID=A0AAU7VLI0_9FIRM
MSKHKENTGFICQKCNKQVLPLTNGSFRNHCPFCLYSKHLDKEPGDRQSQCNFMMKPIDVIYNTKKGYQIIHKCISCGKEQKNKIAEDTVQPDCLAYIALLQAN